MTEQHTGGIRPEVVEFANGILASVDMLAALLLEADSHSADEAVYLRHVCETVRKKAVETIAALHTHLVDVLEEPIDHAGWHYRKGFKKETERFDHEGIGKRVRSAAVQRVMFAYDGSDATAFKRGVTVGAAEAISIMSDIYISDSTKAKVGQLDRYGIPRNPKDDGSVRTYAKGDPIIDVSPIMSQIQE